MTPRSWTRAALVLLVLTALPGCGPDEAEHDDAAARRALDDTRQTVDETAADLMPKVALAVGSTPRGGQADYTLCGMEPSPSGARYRSRPLFEPSPLGARTAVVNLVALLEEESWDVIRPGNPQVVEGARRGLSVRVLVAPATVDLEVTSECVDSSLRTAREYADRTPADVPVAG